MNCVPEISKKYYFFDDGKTSPSRCYVAEVKEIITKKEAKKRDVADCLTLYDIWKREIDSHRQTSNFRVLGAGPVGSPWLYAEDTDYFVSCSIPLYDDNIIWFVRDIHGGWFSLNIQSFFWESGKKLDVTGEIYEQAKYNFDLYEYDGCYDSYLDEILEYD